MPEPSEQGDCSREPSVMDAELAWDLSDIARGHLDATQRNAIYIAIAVGDAFWAVKFLLQAVVRSDLGVRADLVPKLLRWVASYRDHPEHARLAHLIGRIRIHPVQARPGVPARRTVSGPAARNRQSIRSVSGILQTALSPHRLTALNGPAHKWSPKEGVAAMTSNGCTDVDTDH